MITPLLWKGEQNPAYVLLSPHSRQSGNGYTSTPHIAPSVPHRDFKGLIGKPAKSNPGKPIPSSKRNPCPICGDHSGDCRWFHHDDLVLCRSQGHSLRKGESILGADGGSWTYWKRGDLWNTFAPTRIKTARVREVRPSLPVTPAPVRLDTDSRHQAFTTLLQQQSLHIEDAADLIRRGFTHDQIQRMGAKTLKQGLRFKAAPLGLPGFSSGIHNGETGYLVPTRDWDWRINGGQLKPRNGGGYRWLAGCHLASSNELPLQIIPGDPKQPVLFVEGTGPKPWMVHFMTGATVIGAAGGNFTSSPTQLHQTLHQTKNQPRVLLPDGESIYNHHVLDSYKKLAEFLTDGPSEIGYTGLSVRWWDQFHKGSDADETDGSGVLGRLAYEMTSGVTAGVNISYDEAFDTRVSADLKVRFGGPSTTAQRKEVQQLPVINALTSTPSNRDVRVHDGYLWDCKLDWRRFEIIGVWGLLCKPNSDL